LQVCCEGKKTPSDFGIFSAGDSAAQNIKNILKNIKTDPSSANIKKCYPTFLVVLQTLTFVCKNTLFHAILLPPIAEQARLEQNCKI